MNTKPIHKVSRRCAGCLAGLAMVAANVSPAALAADGELDAWLATMPVGGAANPVYSQAHVAAMIDAAINHTAPPPAPPPKAAQR